MGPLSGEAISRLVSANFCAPILSRVKGFESGPEVNRTPDTRFRKPLLYPLSYGAGPAKYNSTGIAGAVASLNRD